MKDGRDQAAGAFGRTLLVLFAAYFAWNSLYYFPYTVDDAFISLRYAYRLVTGHGLVYNVGEYVEGYSNFSWVMLMALFHKLGWPAVIAIKCVGLLAGLATVFLTYVLARHLFVDRATRRLDSVLAVGLLGLNTSLAVWSMAGLETVMLSLLIVAMCLCFELELRGASAFPWSAFIFALAWMTRPEVPVYALYFLIRRWVERERRPWSAADLRWIIAAAAVIVPYELWGLWYYGKLLPATYSAKIGAPGWGGFADSVGRLFVQPELGKFVLGQGPGFTALLLLGAAGCIAGRKTIRPVVWLVPLCGLIFVLYAHRDWMPRHRLFVPVLPLICIGVAYGLGEWLRLARRARVAVALWCIVCGMACFDYARVQMFGGPKTSASQATASRELWFAEVPGRLSRRTYPLQGRARFILENVPPDEYVCLRDIGFPGYASMNPIWDSAGLVTASAARARHDRSEESRQSMFAELAAVRPGCFWLNVTPGKNFMGNWIDEWLRTDPAAKSLYREVRRIPKAQGAFVIYFRNDLAQVDEPTRLRDLESRLPEYARRLRTQGFRPVSP